MARSKNGGSRAFVRGRIGSDVYSIGKDGKGARQQVVRSLAVQVSNPRTTTQMVGRMLMSTVMQALSEFKPIIDHSFDGVASGQPNLSKFISLNYAKLKNYYDNLADGQSGTFNLNKYQEKGLLPGSYQISDGEVPTPTPSIMSGGWGGYLSVKIQTPKLEAEQSFTFAMVKAAWPFGLEDKITMVALTGSNDGSMPLKYQRVSLNLALADATVLTADNIKSAFIFEGNVNPGVYLRIPTTEATGLVCPQIENDPTTEKNSDYGENSVAIRSKKEAGSWKHSVATFDLDNSMFVGYRSKDDALATYPVGSAQFLNGGDL